MNPEYQFYSRLVMGRVKGSEMAAARFNMAITCILQATTYYNVFIYNFYYMNIM